MQNTHQARQNLVIGTNALKEQGGYFAEETLLGYARDATIIGVNACRFDGTTQSPSNVVAVLAIGTDALRNMYGDASVSYGDVSGAIHPQSAWAHNTYTEGNIGIGYKAGAAMTGLTDCNIGAYSNSTYTQHTRSGPFATTLVGYDTKVGFEYSEYSGWWSTAIGYGAKTLYTDTIMIGNTGLSSIRAWGGCSLYTFQGSDRRMKRDLVKLTNVLNIVRQLRPVSFKWREDVLDGHFRDMDEGNIQHINTVGLIAQEAESIIPTLVFDNEDTGYKKMNYKLLAPYLVEAIKDLQHEIINLEEEVKKFENSHK